MIGLDAEAVALAGRQMAAKIDVLDSIGMESNDGDGGR
jgi:hypothetical protein